MDKTNVNQLTIIVILSWETSINNVFPYYVQYLVFWTPLPTLKSDVIYECSLGKII